MRVESCSMMEFQVSECEDSEVEDCRSRSVKYNARHEHREGHNNPSMQSRSSVTLEDAFKDGLLKR